MKTLGPSRLTFILLLCMLSCSTFMHALAGESNSGKIVTPGFAGRLVPADVLVVEFEMETEATSFTDAKRSADGVRESLEHLEITGAKGPITVDYDLGSLKQQSIYWKKGSKAEHQFKMTVAGVEGNHAEMVADIIDQALALDAKITVSSVNAELSDVKYAKAYRELLAEATVSARVNADAIAAASGLQVINPLAIYAAQVPSSEFDLYESVTVSSRARSHRRKKFQVYAAIDPKIEITVELTGVFEAQPLEQQSK
jgi:uncharacterized protein YggE